MPATPYGRKQTAVLQLRHRRQVHRHIYPGATRAGKTFAMVPGFVDWALSHPAPAAYLASQKTWAQIKEGLIPEFQRHAFELGFGDVEPYGSSRYLDIGHMHVVFAEGGKVDSPGKIKSLKFRGVLLNEVTEMSVEYLAMAESRCATYPDWKLVADCNPEGEGHWVKQMLVDPAEDGEPDYEHLPFGLYDNPGIDAAEVRHQFRNHSALWKARMLDGQWVSATGAVYPFWQQRRRPKQRDADLAWMSLDYAASGVMHALYLEQYGDDVIVTDELRYDGMVDGPLSMLRKARRIEQWLNRRPVALVMVDPSTPNEMKAQLADVLQATVVNAPNDIREGVDATAGWLEQPCLYIDPRCEQLRRELSIYVWKESAAAEGRSEPVKRNDHGVDALRYGVAGYPLLWRYGQWTANRIEHALDAEA